MARPIARSRNSSTRAQRVRLALVSFRARPKRGTHPNLARPGTGFVSNVRLDRSQVSDRRAVARGPRRTHGGSSLRRWR